jgi:HD-GYP domain-containing protein (c-di-GMP phosphodiesterase class II)
LRLADSYAALTDARPFRAAMTEEDARRVLVDGAGIEFDPAVVNVFLSLERFPELESFAKTESAEPVEETVNKGRGWDLFSSYS